MFETGALKNEHQYHIWKYPLHEPKYQVGVSAVMYRALFQAGITCLISKSWLTRSWQSGQHANRCFFKHYFWQLACLRLWLTKLLRIMVLERRTRYSWVSRRKFREFFSCCMYWLHKNICAQVLRNGIGFISLLWSRSSWNTRNSS